MKTLQEQLEERAKCKLEEDIYALANAIDRLVKSDHRFERISNSTAFPYQGNAESDKAQINYLFFRRPVIEAVKEKLLGSYIDSEVMGFMAHVDSYAKNQEELKSLAETKRQKKILKEMEDQQ